MEVGLCFESCRWYKPWAPACMWQLAHWTERLQEASARLPGDGPSSKSKTRSHSAHILPAHPCWTYCKCASWEYVAWHPAKVGLATIHILLHWAEIPVRISQRLCEICSYWQLCCDAVFTSSHRKNKVWEHRAAFNSAMQMAVECAGEDPRVFIKCSLQKIELWHKISLREIVQ